MVSVYSVYGETKLLYSEFTVNGVSVYTVGMVKQGSVYSEFTVNEARAYTAYGQTKVRLRRIQCRTVVNSV